MAIDKFDETAKDQFKKNYETLREVVVDAIRFRTGEKLKYTDTSKFSEKVSIEKGYPHLIQAYLQFNDQAPFLAPITHPSDEGLENTNPDVYLIQELSELPGDYLLITCRGSCVGECSTGCSIDCMGGCYRVCSGCGNGCGANCKDWCENACKNKCGTECTGGCSRGCDRGCQAYAKGDQTSCADCSNGCTGAEKGTTGTVGPSICSGCSTTCSEKCDGGCSGFCSGCSEKCLSSCGVDCNTQCYGTCQGSCGGNMTSVT